jgi:formylglycine-generating enzyme required for sulfatase activity
LKTGAKKNGISEPTLAQPSSSSFIIGGMEFILIPKGKFLMGSRDDNPNAHDDEKPMRLVELADYYIDRFPVTNQQFNEFIKATQYVYKRVRGCKKKLDHPVVDVSWRDAMAFCEW